MKQILPKLKASEQQQTISTCANVRKFLMTTKDFVNSALCRVTSSQTLGDLCEAIDVELLTQLCNDVVPLQTRTRELQSLVVQRCRENTENYEQSLGMNMVMLGSKFRLKTFSSILYHTYSRLCSQCLLPIKVQRLCGNTTT